MESLYFGDKLAVTRQKDGSVFVIRPDERPQQMITFTRKEWLHILTMEMMKNEDMKEIQKVLDEFKKELDTFNKK